MESPANPHQQDLSELDDETLRLIARTVLGHLRTAQVHLRQLRVNSRPLLEELDRRGFSRAVEESLGRFQ